MTVPSDEPLAGAEAAVNKKIEYCIFDMDGLLVDTERIYTEVTDEILSRYGFEFSWEVKAGAMGKNQRESALHILTSYPGLLDKLPLDDYLAERNAMQDEKFRKVKPMQGAVELVQHLHERGVPIALATGSGYLAFLAKTSHLPHLFERFPADCILTADSPEVPKGRTKPNPDIFLAAARALGRKVGSHEEPANDAEREERARGLAFEDAILGVQAGVRAGMPVIWVPDVALRALNPEETYGSSEIFESLSEFKPEAWGLPAM